jgi:stage V sporulation protein R
MSLLVDGDLLFQGSEWDFGTLRRTYKAIESVAVDELGLDI